MVTGKEEETITREDETSLVEQIGTDAKNVISTHNQRMFDSSLPALELGKDHDRAKRLLFSNIHVILDISEHRRFKEETCQESQQHTT